VIGRDGLAVALDELAAQPAEDLVGDAEGRAHVGIPGEAAGLEALSGERVHQFLERHPVLERDGGVATVSMRPPMVVVPFLEIWMKISPGRPSGKSPTVRDPR
jgi:hypothetical protein